MAFPEDRSLYCAHVTEHCGDRDLLAGRLDYLYLTYCTCSGFEWLGLSIIVFDIYNDDFESIFVRIYAHEFAV